MIITSFCFGPSFAFQVTTTIGREEMFKRLNLVIVFILLLSYGLNNVIADERVSDVPETWLDSLTANSWKMKRDDLCSYKMKMVTHVKKKDGEEMYSETEYLLVNIIDGVEMKPIEIDEFGNVLDEEKAKKSKKAKDDKDKESSPLAPFKEDNRMNYSFELLEPDEFGNPRFKYYPVKKLKKGFLGTVTIDSTNWVTLNIQGEPIKKPKMIKEMTMNVDYVPVEGGRFRMDKMAVDVYAKMLLISSKIRSETYFYDYELAETSEENAITTSN